MIDVTSVTGNKSKLQEWRRLLPSDFDLSYVEIDLDEIQSLNLAEVAQNKARSAYGEIGKPVLVEDVSAGLVTLNGLPGPFIRYFEEKLGEDALYKLASENNKTATITCVIVYYDGTITLTAKGVTKGRVVTKRGDKGFGFDKVFMPDGYDKTYSEMSYTEKDLISHRAKAISSIISKLKDHFDDQI